MKIRQIVILALVSGVALLGFEQSSDKSDDNLNFFQRVKYNVLLTSRTVSPLRDAYRDLVAIPLKDDPSDPVALAIKRYYEAVLLAQQLAESEQRRAENESSQQLAESEYRRAEAAARIAPAVDVTDILSMEDTLLNGENVANNIRRAYQEGYLMEWEAQSLAREFAMATKMKVLPEEEYTSKNSASEKEVVAFKQKIVEVLTNETVGRSHDAAEHVQGLIVGSTRWPQKTESQVQPLALPVKSANE